MKQEKHLQKFTTAMQIPEKIKQPNMKKLRNPKDSIKKN